MLLFFTIIGSALFANAKLVPRIIKGENAWIETYPYQVSLEYRGNHLCGGSIISKHYVLTAAHCGNLVSDMKTVSVRAGSSFPGKGGSLHQVVKYVGHEGFDFEKYKVPINDVAVIEVKEPFVFDDTRQPIELLEANEKVTPGAKSVVTGFGLVDEKNIADQLQVAVLSIVSKEACKKLHKVLPEGQICAMGQNGTDSCTGDSGGPIAVEGRLVGVVSWGKKCGDSGYPSVYSEIAYFRDWINKHVQF